MSKVGERSRPPFALASRRVALVFVSGSLPPLRAANRSRPCERSLSPCERTHPASALDEGGRRRERGLASGRVAFAVVEGGRFRPSLRARRPSLRARRPPLRAVTSPSFASGHVALVGGARRVALVGGARRVALVGGAGASPWSGERERRFCPRRRRSLPHSSGSDIALVDECHSRTRRRISLPPSSTKVTSALVDECHFRTRRRMSLPHSSTNITPALVDEYHSRTRRRMSLPHSSTNTTSALVDECHFRTRRRMSLSPSSGEVEGGKKG
ncbi:hypothetical protein BD626DRAFT_23871 [Schizophyllum amplum]|uniref:Uncharacterized protein n=1 Tax=Schizophyllum amplum TaxID=97359 RepID=A0A550CZB2_9AGAR|nr:hypothetical protein BD626DRAFT_23871 [Auriculariopsis ampla]